MPDAGPAGHTADWMARAGLGPPKSRQVVSRQCEVGTLAEVISLVSWAALGLLRRSALVSRVHPGIIM